MEKSGWDGPRVSLNAGCAPAHPVPAPVCPPVPPPCRVPSYATTAGQSVMKPPQWNCSGDTEGQWISFRWTEANLCQVHRSTRAISLCAAMDSTIHAQTMQHTFCLLYGIMPTVSFRHPQWPLSNPWSLPLLNCPGNLCDCIIVFVCSGGLVRG